MLKIATILTCTVSALAESRTKAPAGALVVSKDAGSGQFPTIQSAVDALSASSSSTQSIFVNPGTYNEQVYIKALNGPLAMYGYTEDTDSYSSNQVIITATASQASGEDDDETATLRVWTTNFKLYNVNVANSYGMGSQALALSASAGEQGYYACQFKGFQDTVLAETGAQLYAKSYIEGGTDFIFGQHAEAWFDSCDIRVPSTTLGYITASGRASADDSSYYVLNNCTIAAAEGADVPSGAMYLGRPWSDYARVAVQDTSMTHIINAAGWSQWESSEPNTDHVSFGEYGNSGAGAEGTRAAFATKLSRPVSIDSILGSGYESAAWVDISYLS